MLANWAESAGVYAGVFVCDEAELFALVMSVIGRDQNAGVSRGACDCGRGDVYAAESVFIAMVPLGPASGSCCTILLVEII